MQVLRQVVKYIGCLCSHCDTWIAISPRLSVPVKNLDLCAPHLLVFFSSLCFLFYFCYCFLYLFCQSHAGWFSCLMVSCLGSRENKVGFGLVCVSNCPKVCLGAESSSAGFQGARLHFACSQNKHAALQ